MANVSDNPMSNKARGRAEALRSLAPVRHCDRMPDDEDEIDAMPTFFYSTATIGMLFPPALFPHVESDSWLGAIQAIRRAGIEETVRWR
jgi:hypothetical protein